MSHQVQASGKGRRQLVMLITLFLLPPLAAWLAWQYVGEHGVSATTNKGVLIRPVRTLQLEDGLRFKGETLDRSEFAGRWMYVVFGGASCEEACQQQLYVTRQTRIAVNKDMPRVRRLLVLDSPADTALVERLAQDHEDLLIATSIDAELRGQFRGEQFANQGGYFFLVDPLGNLMMAYKADAEPRGVLRDLQKLLKVSQVG